MLLKGHFDLIIINIIYSCRCIHLCLAIHPNPSFPLVPISLTISLSRQNSTTLGQVIHLIWPSNSTPIISHLEGFQLLRTGLHPALYVIAILQNPTSTMGTTQRQCTHRITRYHRSIYPSSMIPPSPLPCHSIPNLLVRMGKVLTTRSGLGMNTPHCSIPFEAMTAPTSAPARCL